MGGVAHGYIESGPGRGEDPVGRIEGCFAEGGVPGAESGAGVAQVAWIPLVENGREGT